MSAVLICAVVFAVVVALVSWYFSADQRARRAIRGVSRCAVRDAGEGQKVRVVGRAEVEEPLTAPLSGRPCACWRVIVEEQRSSGKNRYWKTIVDEQEAVDFALGCHVDGSRAVVKADLVQAVLEKDGNYSSGTFNDATPELEAFLIERGHSSKGWVFNKQIRYREGALEPGETVAVVGVARWERDPDERPRAGGGYREAVAPQRLVLEAPVDGPLLISDEPAMQR